MKETEIRLSVPEDLKNLVRKYRAQKELQNQPLSSDAKAILELVKIGLLTYGLSGGKAKILSEVKSKKP